MTALALPFEGLPPVAQAVMWVAFVVIVGGLVWTSLLFAASRGALARAPEPSPEGADGFLWAFLVPALDEEVTIADSVARLLEVEARHKVVLVIDDGSTDGTATVLDGLDAPELAVLHRTPPDARRGKAAALNAAWRHLDGVLAEPALARWSRDRVIVVVVDADGRLHPTVPAYAAAHFADPAVGGMQTLVRIYNRSGLLAWLQDVEFSIYGLLFQAGRTAMGIAGMGGNGQLNRLSALDSVVEPDAEGPWRDRLTEDQDLGLRLLHAGWRCVADARATVDQQGLSSLRRLLRQRTRWAQGNLQAMAHLRRSWRAPLPVVARLDLIAYLIQPVLQAVVGVAFALAIAVAVTGTAGFWSDDMWLQLAFFFLLGFGGVVLGCLARGARSGTAGLLRSLAIVPLVAGYAWLIWPVLARAATRQAARRESWAKTAREPIEAAASPERPSGAPG